jgi:hypothetical protein
VKRGVPEAAAQQYQEALTAIGARVELRKSVPVAPAPVPVAAPAPAPDAAAPAIAAVVPHGAVMLAAELQTDVAVAASIQVVRACVRLRSLLADHRELAQRLDAVEARYDGQFKTVFAAIRALMTPPEKPARRIGFRAERKV